MNGFGRALTRLFAPEQRPTFANVTRNVALSGLRAAILSPVPFLVIPFIHAHAGMVDTAFGLCA
jgi:hypothetical protein